jgi:hypothetical protein
VEEDEDKSKQDSDLEEHQVKHMENEDALNMRIQRMILILIQILLIQICS